MNKVSTALYNVKIFNCWHYPTQATTYVEINQQNAEIILCAQGWYAPREHAASDEFGICFEFLQHGDTHPHPIPDHAMSPRTLHVRG